MPSIPNKTVLSNKDPVLSSPSYLDHKGYATVETLNDWIEADIKNYSKLYGRITDIRGEIEKTNSVASIQASSYSTALETAQNTLLSGGYYSFNGIYFDFHSMTGIENSTTAQKDTSYGQLIIPPESSLVANQFVLRDALTRIWVPKETQVWMGWGDDPADISSPSLTGWLQDTDADSVLRAFDEKPFTASVYAPQDSYFFLKVIYPIGVMSNRLTNAICVHPFPEFGSTLVYADYLTSSNANVILFTGTEIAQKKRWIIQPTALNEIRFVWRNTYNSPLLGAYHVGSYFYKWNTSAVINIDTTPWNPTDTISNVQVESPSSSAPLASFVYGSPLIQVNLSLLSDNTPQCITGLKVTY
jgi:hypothetical protein